MSFSERFKELRIKKGLSQDQLADALNIPRTSISHYERDGQLKTGLKNKKNLVFINTKMEIVTHNAVNKTLKNLCRKAGVKEVTTHCLRHTHASMLLYNGVNVKYISRRLGHKDIITTLQIYSHIIDEMEQKGSRQVDDTMKEIFA